MPTKYAKLANFQDMKIKTTFILKLMSKTSYKNCNELFKIHDLDMLLRLNCRYVLKYSKTIKISKFDEFLARFQIVTKNSDFHLLGKLFGKYSTKFFIKIVL